MNISRREAIKLSLAGGGVLLSPFGFPQIASAQLSPQIPRFQAPFRVPPVLQPKRSDETTDYYEITIKKSAIEILPGLQTEIWGYNGISPGPTIRQRGGNRSEGGRFSTVRFINQLDKDPQGRLINHVVHLHGMASLPQYDGYAIDYIPPQHFNDTRTHTIMRFDVVRQEPDDSIIPNQLRPVEPLRNKPINRTRNFRFERNNGEWKINNRTWDSQRIDANPQAGDVEIWELVNPGSGWVHPVHIHLVDLQLLDISKNYQSFAVTSS